MGVDWRAADDAETFGLQGLQPDLVAVRCPRLLNPGDKQTLERLEQQVLHRNREREHAVEEGVDHRQFVLEATIAALQRQAGRRFEAGEWAAFAVRPEERRVGRGRFSTCRSRWS